MFNDTYFRVVVIKLWEENTQNFFVHTNIDFQPSTKMTDNNNILLFQALNSSVNVTFWYEFAKKKLEVYKLKEDPIPVYGYYSIEGHVDLPAQLQLDIDSFSADLK